MNLLRNIVIFTLLLLVVSACESKSRRGYVPSSSTSYKYTAPTPKTPTTEPSVGTTENNDYSEDKKFYSEYAERKKTSELEEEYYDVFGDDFLDHVDDEEYEAAEDYDYDEEEDE